MMQDTEQWACIHALSRLIRVSAVNFLMDNCLAHVQLTRCTTLQAATSVVASFIHSRYVGLDMTRKLSVPCHAPLAQQVGCETEEPGAAATNSHAAHGCASPSRSTQSQVSSQAHALQEEAKAGPQKTANSGQEHASKPGPIGDRPGTGEQQQDVPCGQMKHHVSFTQAPQQLGMPVRGHAALSYKSCGPDNPFQQFTFGQSGEQITDLISIRKSMSLRLLLA